MDYIGSMTLWQAAQTHPVAGLNHSMLEGQEDAPPVWTVTRTEQYLEGTLLMDMVDPSDNPTDLASFRHPFNQRLSQS